MELRQLRHFAAVAMHGNFSRAARHLHLTQPALSRQVKNLEMELGVTLLKREANSTSLTALGQTFFEDTREVLADLDRAIRRIRKVKGETPLRIGYIPALTSDMMPRVLSRFQANKGHAKPELLQRTPDDMAAMASAGRLDMVIMPKGTESSVPTFRWTELRQLPSVLIMSRKHAFAKLKRVSPKLLHNQPLHGYARSEYSGYAPWLKAALVPFGVRPQFAHEDIESTTALFASLEADAGLAVVSEGHAQIRPSSLVSRPFYPALSPWVTVVGLPAIQPKTQAETFLKLLLEAASNKKCK